MPFTPSDLQTEITNIKTTTSGKVEYNSGSASMRTTLAIIQDMAFNNMVFPKNSIADMQATSGTQMTYISVTALSAGASAGLYKYRSAGTPNGTDTFSATGGGVWRKAELANQV